MTVLGFTLMGFLWRVTATLLVLMFLSLLFASLVKELDGPDWPLFIAGVFILLFIISLTVSLVGLIWVWIW